MSPSATFVRFILLSMICFWALPVSAQIHDHALPTSSPRVLGRSGVLFTENKGQIVDTKGELRPEILFKAETRGLTVFFSQNRISYSYMELSDRMRAFIKRDFMSDPDADHPGDTPDGMPNPDSVMYRTHRVDLEFVGGNPSPVVTSSDPSAERSIYYLANCPNGVTARSYRTLTYHDIYPKIDLVISAGQKGVKYDFIVHPGGRPSDIAMRYVAAGKVEITGEGKLQVMNTLGYMEEDVPYTYQKGGSNVQTVRSAYRLADGVIRFYVGEYDRSRDLVIDPTQQWATFYGGSGNETLNGGDPTEVDRGGNSFMAGYTLSNPFPTTAGAAQTTFRGPAAGTGDAFLVKFDPYGNVVFATYFGGTGNEIAHGVSSDADGNVFITGHTESTTGNMPTTSGAYQVGFGGGGRDAFVAKFNPAGTLLWSTHIGGNDWDDGYAFAVDSSKNVAVTVTTESPNPGGAWVAGTNFLNAKPGGGGNKDILVMKFNAAGTQSWGKFVGGSGTEYAYAAASDINDNIILTGWSNSANFPLQNAAQPFNGGGYDAVVVKLSSGGTTKWSTFYGGTGTENDGFGGVGYSGMATDLDGDVYITGSTQSPNFPTTAGSFQPLRPGGVDAFIVKFDTNGVRQWATYFGGGGTDYGIGAASNTQGSVLITGITNSAGLQTNGFGQQAPFQAGLNGGNDAYIVKLDRLGAAKWITYFGSNGTDEGEGISYDPYGSIFLAGHTNSAGPAPFMLLSPHQIANGQPLARPGNSGSQDAFITSFCDPDPVRIDSSGPTTFCNSDSVIFKILYGYLNVKWFKRGDIGQPDIFLSSFDSIVIKESGRYYVRVENAGGCLAGSDTILVTKLDRLNPAINPGPTVNLCTGDTVTLNVGPGPYTQYTWKKVGVTIGTNATYKATQGGTYQVVVVNAIGCTDSTTVTVNEYPKPSDVNVTPADTVVMCEGETRVLTANGGAGGTITWSNGSVGTTATVGAAGIYFAKSTGGNGCEKVSNKVVVKINKKPLPKILPLLPVTFCQGDSTVLAVVMTTGGPTTPYKSYLWSPGGETTDKIVRKVSGDVTVTVTDTNGCQNTATVTVTVNEIPHPKILVRPDTVICEGDSVTLSLDQAYGGYRWNTGGTDSRINVGRTGAYAVTVSSFGGCEATSDSVHIRVVPAPVANISGPIAVCTNTPGSYSVPPKAGLSYDWKVTGPSGTVSSATNTANLDVNWGGAGKNKVIVTVTDISSGCKAYDTLDVEVGSVLVPNITYVGSTRLCPGDSIELDAGPGYTKYTWSPGGEQTRKITVKAAGSYTVAVENAGGCNGTSNPVNITIGAPPVPTITVEGGRTALCPGDTVWLDAGAGYSDYLWSNGFSNRRIPVWRADSFLVSVTDTSGCTGVSQKVYITMNTPPNTVITGPNSVCINSADDYEVAGDPADSYQWTLTGGNGTITTGTSGQRVTVRWDAAGTGTLEVIQISAATGCRDTARYDVNVGTTLTPSITSSRAAAFCDGDSVTLTAAAGYKTYTWDNGATGQVIVVKTAGTYKVTVTDAGGCSGTGEITVTQKAKIDPKIIPDGTPGLCPGDSLKLEATPGFMHYLWAPSGDTTRIIYVKNAGVYTVMVTDIDSCVGVSSGVAVTLYPAIATPRIVPAGDTLVALVDSVDSPQPSTYQWYLNGAPIGGANAKRYYTTVTGAYSVTVVDSNGCRATSLPYTPTSTMRATVEVPTISAIAGQRVEIPVYLSSSENLDRNNVHNYTAKLRFNASLLIPVDKTYPSIIDNGDRVMTITGSRQQSMETGELVRLKFIAALGNAESTPLLLETFGFDDTQNGVVPVTRVNGEFHLDSLCRNGGTRLIDATGAIGLKPARPNPTGDRAEIEYEVVETGRTQLYLVDLLGKRVVTLVDGDIEAGSYRVELDASRLESGMYLYVLQTPTQRLSRMLEVVK